MIITRPLFQHDRERVRRMLIRNADDLNWAPSEVHERALKIARDASLGVKAIRTAELSSDNGQCLGVAILNRGDHASTKHTAWLRVVVDREVRGQGIGRELVVHALQIADEAGIVRVEAQPYAASDFVNFWAHAGFRFEGRRRKAARDVHTGKLIATEVWVWHG